MIQSSEVASAGELRCLNCSSRLDPSDKFCRECGLPTQRLAEVQRWAGAPPDARELKRALDVAADAQPFARMENSPPDGAADFTTGSVVRATSPTLATQMAATTLAMVALIVVLTTAGVVLLVVAFRP